MQNAHKEISQTSTSSSVQFRHRLLASVLLLQSLMSVTELGLLHYEPIRDSETGSTVILTVHEAKDTRQVPGLKWTSQSKFERKVSVSVSAAAAESPTGNGVGALDATNRLYFSLKVRDSDRARLAEAWAYSSSTVYQVHSKQKC